MTTWIALFRGINVGGNNSLPMKSLVALMEHEGFADVRTYIQSGNAVFRGTASTAKTLAKRIGEAVQKNHGFFPKILVLSAKELAAAAASNPFPQAEAEHKSLHLFFLAEEPKSADLAGLNRLKAAKEAFVLKDKTFYLHAPDGIGKSKLATSTERLLKVDTTARNWRTVTALLEMARDSN